MEFYPLGLQTVVWIEIPIRQPSFCSRVDTKLKPFRLPRLGGREIPLSSEVKSLSVVLDSKLNWKQKTEERMKKGLHAFYRALDKSFQRKILIRFMLCLTQLDLYLKRCMA